MKGLRFSENRSCDLFLLYIALLSFVPALRMIFSLPRDPYATRSPCSPLSRIVPHRYSVNFRFKLEGNDCSAGDGPGAAASATHPSTSSSVTQQQQATGQRQPHQPGHRDGNSNPTSSAGPIPLHLMDPAANLSYYSSVHRTAEGGYAAGFAHDPAHGRFDLFLL